MENKVEFQANTLLITPQGIDKIFSFKKKLTIPYSHIAGATIDQGIWNESKGLRAPGTNIPGFYYAGIYKREGETCFYNIKRASLPVVIQLKNEEFDRLIIGVDNAREVVDQINNAI